MNPPRVTSVNSTPDSSKWPRWGVIAVVYQPPRFLVIRRSEQVRAPGAFCFPGGGVEKGETEEIALAREMEEELSASIQIVGRVWENQTPRGTRLGWWQAHLRDEAQLQANPAEVAEIHWLTVPEILDLPELLPTNRDFLAGFEAGNIQLKSN